MGGLHPITWKKQKRKMPVLGVSCDCSLLQQSSPLSPPPGGPGASCSEVLRNEKVSMFLHLYVGLFSPCASFMFCTL